MAEKITGQFQAGHQHSPRSIFSISSLMDLADHAVVRGPRETGLGNRPSLTPAHHVDFDTGISSKTELSLKKPEFRVED